MSGDVTDVTPNTPVFTYLDADKAISIEWLQIPSFILYKSIDKASYKKPEAGICL